MTEDTLTRAEQMLRDRRDELRPTVDEYMELEAAMAALLKLDLNGQAPAKRGPGRPAKPQSDVTEPNVGAVYESATTSTGRTWIIMDEQRPGQWALLSKKPGDRDRWMYRSTGDLMNPKKWVKVS